MFDILVGSSSEDIEAIGQVEVTSDYVEPIRLTWNTTVGDMMAHPRTKPIVEAMMAKMMGPDSPMAGLTMENDEMMKAMIAESPLRMLRMFAGPAVDWSFLEAMMDA